MKISNLFKMRNILILAIAVLFGSACQTKSKSEQIAELKSANDSLAVAISERDALMNDMIETFNQIETDLAFIKEQRNIISANSENAENEVSKKEQIVKDVQDLAKMLQESKIRIDELNKKLKNSGVKIASLEKRVDELSTNLETRNSELIALTQDLEKKNFEVGVLTEQLVALETIKSDQDNVIKDQTAAIDGYNKAYYTLGTSKELKEKGIITKEGGLLGIGKTKMLSTEANNSFFSEFDMRQLSSIPVNAKEAHLISEHPSGSYEFISENEQVASLSIKNPAEFYKFTKYIVVEIK
jgi:predicted  nucleic acid-binding Zn-ribbon protein